MKKGGGMGRNAGQAKGGGQDSGESDGEELEHDLGSCCGLTGSVPKEYNKEPISSKHVTVSYGLNSSE